MPRPGCAMAVFWQPWVAGSLRGKQTSMAAAACTLELVAWRSADGYDWRYAGVITDAAEMT